MLAGRDGEVGMEGEWTNLPPILHGLHFCLIGFEFLFGHDDGWSNLNRIVSVSGCWQD